MTELTTALSSRRWPVLESGRSVVSRKSSDREGLSEVADSHNGHVAAISHFIADGVAEKIGMTALPQFIQSHGLLVGA